MARFNRVETTGFVSGPLTDTLAARLSVRAIEGGDYQYSLTRPDDALGASREIQGRLLPRLQAGRATRAADQFNGIARQLRYDCPATRSGRAGRPRAGRPRTGRFTDLSNDPRAADWTPGFSDRSHDHFFQASVRAEYALSDDISLISVTNVAHQTIDKMLEQDGSAAYETQVNPYGRLMHSTRNCAWLDRHHN